MKEAAGEANMTVVTIILIGVIVAIATPIINGMMNNTAKRACCADAGGVWSGTACKAPSTTTSNSGYNQSAYNTCVKSAGGK